MRSRSGTAEAVQLRQRFRNLTLIGRSRQQQGKRDPKLRAVDADLLQTALLVVGVLVGVPSNPQPLVVVLLVKLLQHRRFVVTVGTPRPEDIDDQRLAGKFRTALIQRFARLIDAAEAERLLRILDLRQCFPKRIRIGRGLVLRALRRKRLEPDDPALLAFSVPSASMLLSSSRECCQIGSGESASPRSPRTRCHAAAPCLR